MTPITSAKPLGRGLAQAGIMNINERKRSSASARASQAICGQPFCPLINGFSSRICSSKRLLVHFKDNAIYGEIAL